MDSQPEQFAERPTRRARVTNPLAAKLRSLILEGINLQDGLLGDCLDALRAVLPYVVELDEGGGPSECKYCHKPLPASVVVCSVCAVGMANDVLALVPELGSRQYTVPPKEEEDKK